MSFPVTSFTFPTTSFPFLFAFAFSTFAANAIVIIAIRLIVGIDVASMIQIHTIVIREDSVIIYIITFAFSFSFILSFLLFGFLPLTTIAVT